MKIISLFPYSACSSCQSIYIKLMVSRTDLVFQDIDQQNADYVIIPSLIKKQFFQYLLNSIEKIPYPRQIIAVGDSHRDLGKEFIYTPEKIPVTMVVQGCPVDLRSLEEKLSL